MEELFLEKNPSVGLWVRRVLKSIEARATDSLTSIVGFVTKSRRVRALSGDKTAIIWSLSTEEKCFTSWF